MFLGRLASRLPRLRLNPTPQDTPAFRSSVGDVSYLGRSANPFAEYTCPFCLVLALVALLAVVVAARSKGPGRMRGEVEMRETEVEIDLEKGAEPEERVEGVATGFKSTVYR